MTKKVLKGIVTSAKNNKTVVVEVIRNLNTHFMKKLLKDQKNITLMMKKINLKKVKKFQ